MASSNVTVFYLDNSSWYVMQLPSSVNSIYDIVLIVLLTIVIIVTIVGNVLVCLAVCIVRKLRKPCNYLLVSLAISDLCVAILVMPIALLYEFFDVWIFGTIICDLWVSFDVLSCTASILNLCMISVDRYYAITKPLEYGVKRTPKRMICCVFLVWFGAACISLPPLFILGNEHTVRLENGDTIEQCIVCQNFAYQLYATLGSFYLPLLVMIIVYYKIFQAARKIVLEEKKAQRHLADNYYFPELHLKLVKNNAAAPVHGNHCDPNKRKYFETNQTNDSSDACIVNRNLISVTNNNKLIISMNSSTSHKKLRFQLANERKASTTLGIIMSAFVVCWLPFFVLALVRPFLNKRTQIPDYLSSLFLWLGYTNSLLNPVIYATLNRDFRKPFKEILFGRCSNLNKMMREDFYHSQYGDPEQCQSTKFNLDDDDNDDNDDDYADDDDEDYDDKLNLAVRNNNQLAAKTTAAPAEASATGGTSSESFL